MYQASGPKSFRVRLLPDMAGGLSPPETGGNFRRPLRVAPPDAAPQDLNPARSTLPLQR